LSRGVVEESCLRGIWEVHKWIERDLFVEAGFADGVEDGWLCCDLWTAEAHFISVYYKRVRERP
jgi:hypothetical protein